MPSLILTLDIPEHGPARFAVRQMPLFNYLDGRPDHLKWRTSPLFPQYNDKTPPHIPTDYRADLLTPAAENPTGDDRREFAGYEDNPGAITLRGRSLGELSIRISGTTGYTDAQVRGFGSPTPGELAFIETHILPAVREFTAAHHGALYQTAKAETEAHTLSQIRDARAELDKREAEARAALALLP